MKPSAYVKINGMKRLYGNGYIYSAGLAISLGLSILSVHLDHGEVILFVAGIILGFSAAVALVEKH